MSAPALDLMDLGELVRDAVASGDPARLEQLAAQMAQMGHVSTAATLLERAEALKPTPTPTPMPAPAAEPKAAEPAPAAPAAPEQRVPILLSPFSEVADLPWSRFVAAMRVAELGTVGPAYHLGLFAFSVRRLADLGMCEKVREGEHAGRKAWQADFVPPYSLDLFLRDPRLQYRVFCASAEDYRQVITSQHAHAIGRPIDGKTATLSGLLAVATCAGPGLGSWIAKEEDRKKYQRTTAAYARTTGLF